MKKLRRIVSLLLAVVMIFGVFGVAGSAYAPYKGDAISDSSNYDDVDSPALSLEQFASMALDELDRMLAKEKLVLDVMIGTLDLSSVDGTINSLKSLLDSISSLLSLVGDASALNTAFNETLKKNNVLVLRNKNGTGVPENQDLVVCKALFDFIARLAPILGKYVDNSLNLGFLQSFVSEYIFNMRSLIVGLIFGAFRSSRKMEPEYDFFDDDGGENFLTPEANGGRLPDKYKDAACDDGLRRDAISYVLQDYVYDEIYGEWKKLDNYFDKIDQDYTEDGVTKNYKYTEVRYDLYSFADDYGETEPDTAAYDYYGWVHPKDWVTVGLGGCARVGEGASAPAPQYGALEFFDPDSEDGVLTTSTYDFIETALQRAYNYIAVPVLNRDVRLNIRKLCGIEYDSQKWNKTRYNSTTGKDEKNPTYDPDYDGERPSDFYKSAPNDSELNTDKYPYLKIFDYEVKAPKITIPTGVTLIEYLNTMLGEICNAALATKLPAGHATSGEITSDSVKAYDGQTDASWTWNYGSDGKGNQYLFKNIASVAKFVVLVSGDLLFGDVYLPTGSEGLAGKESFPAASAVHEWNDQLIVSFVLRSLLNAFVDWMYIEPTYTTVAQVLYRACEQLAWQDMPERTYPEPQSGAETRDVIDAALNILMDEAVYGLNQGFDMLQNNLTTNRGNDPEARAGLLQYLDLDAGETYEDRLAQIVDWAVSNYGKLIALDLNYKNVVRNADGSIQSVNDETTGFGEKAWADLDTIINAIIPIKADNAPWLYADIGSIKTLLFDYILVPICDLNADKFQKIFWKNDGTSQSVRGELADAHIEAIIIKFIGRVFDLIVPGVFQVKSTLDEIINPPKSETLAEIVESLIGALDATSGSGRGADLIEAAFPILCYVLKLNRDQEFKEMEIFIDETLPVDPEKDPNDPSKNKPDFQIYNGSSGLNTAHTKKAGEPQQFIHDELYAYKITEIQATRYPSGSPVALNGVAINDVIQGGDMKNVYISSRSEGDLIVITIKYVALGENGQSMLQDAQGDISFSKTAYCYIGAANKDDDEAYEEINLTGDRKLKYNRSIYLSRGQSLDKIEDYGVVVIDKTQTNAQAPFGKVEIELAENPARPSFVEANTEAPNENNTNKNVGPQDLKLDGAYHFLYPFKAAVDEQGEALKRKVPVYVPDEDDATKDKLDDDGLPIPVDPPEFEGTVEDGAYTVTETVRIKDADGTVTDTQEITTYIHLYNDYGLPGLFESCVALNRQLADYEDTGGLNSHDLAYTNYCDSLSAAARLVLTPKKGDTFANEIAASEGSQYANKYEECYRDLQAKIRALDEYRKASESTDDLENAIASYSGRNFTKQTYTYTLTGETAPTEIDYKDYLEYDDAAYKHFGICDAVPHTYRKYRDAKSRAENIINSQQFYGPAPLEPDKFYSPGEIEDYENAVKKYTYNKDHASVVDAAKTLYAKHMLDLTGERLIYFTPDKSKLDALMDRYGGYAANHPDLTNFSEASKADYIRAKEFAQLMNGTAGDKPSEVKAASAKLVYYWKKLAPGLDYSTLDAAISVAQSKLTAASYGFFNPPVPGAAAQTHYTAETYKPFYDAYFDAMRIDRNLSSSVQNQNLLGNITTALTAATEALTAVSAGPFDIEFITTPAGRFKAPLPTLDPTNAIKRGRFSRAELADGTKVDNYILGWTPGIKGKPQAQRCVANLDVIDVDIEPYTSRGFGSGTVFKVYRKGQMNMPDAEKKVYQVTFFGDIDGDGAITITDSGLLAQCVATKLDLSGSTTKSLYKSADVDGDWSVSASDTAKLKSYLNAQVAIDQSISKGVRTQTIGV